MSKFAGLGFAVEEPFRLVLTHPLNDKPWTDKEGKEFFIDILSMDSKAARTAQAAAANRRIGSKNKVTIEELRAEQTDLLAALTKGWYLVNVDGTPIDVPFSEANAREFYELGAFADVRDQVVIAASSRANFMPKPPSA